MIRLDSNDADSYFGRGRAKFEIRRESISDFDKAIGINPDASYYYWRGLSKYYRKTYKEAILDFDEVISDFDKAIVLPETDCYYWRGLSKYRLGEYEVAILDFDAAISAMSGTAEVIKLLAKIFDLDETDKIIRMDRLKGHLHHWRGLAKFRMGEFRQAIPDFDKAIALNPDNGDSYYWRGVTKKAMNLFGPARDDFHKAMKCAEEGEDYNLQGIIKYALSLIKSDESLCNSKK